MVNFFLYSSYQTKLRAIILKNINELIKKKILIQETKKSLQMQEVENQWRAPWLVVSLVQSIHIKYVVYDNLDLTVIIYITQNIDITSLMKNMLM